MAGLPPPGGRAYADANLKNVILGETMQHPLLAAASVALGLAWTVSFPVNAPAQGVAALSGLVSSAEEAAMEGVLVSATKAGSNITVTIVTGADGRYSFPANRLGPGQYTLAVRAVGYELDQPQGIEVASIEAPAQKVSTKDLKLGKTKDLAAQLSNTSCARNMIPTAS
jgi:virginiamycin B lyase